jgi:cobalt-zinc-cadmium efflux system outer membrane protein
VAARTLAALFAAAAADQSLALATEIERGAQALGTAMAARAAEGLMPPVEADLAAAEALRLASARLESESRRAAARAELAAMLGMPAAQLPDLAPSALPEVHPASLAPLIAHALAARADLTAAAAERQAAAARIQRARRQRLPDLSLSVFAERDGFGERVLGGGLRIPLFLPSPLAPSGRGEITEAEARRAQAEDRLEGVRRRVREEVERALASWQARRAALDRYALPLIRRAREHVLSLGEAIRARQLSPREALLAQRTFIELLQNHLEARLAETLARLELLRAAGLALPGVSS